MTSRNRRDAAPLIAPDGSTIHEFLNPRNSSLQNQSLAQATLFPGQSTAAHFHPRTEEIYFVLSGRGQMRIEETVFDVGQGDAIPIAPGKNHQIWNTDEASELVFLCCCAPAYADEDTILSG